METLCGRQTGPKHLWWTSWGVEDLRSDVVEEISSEVDCASVWPDYEYHQRRDTDRGMKQQKWQSFAEVVTGAAEEDLGHELDGLTRDRDVVQ